MMHAKTIIIDDWIIVGSSNLNHRSMLHDLEVDIVLQTPESRQTIIDQFKEDLALSHQVHQLGFKKKIFYKRWIGKWLSYFKHWI